MVQKQIRHVLVWSGPQLLLQPSIWTFRIRNRWVRPLNTWSRSNIWCNYSRLKLSSRALKLRNALTADWASLVNIWILSDMILTPVEPILKTFQVELVSFQNIFVRRQIWVLIVHIYRGYLHWVEFRLRKVSIHVRLSFGVSILPTVCFDHDLPFFDLVQTNRATHILYFFIIPQKLLVSAFAQLFRLTRNKLRVSPALRTLHQNINPTDTYRGICWPKYMLFFLILTLFTPYRFFISEHFLLEWGLQLILGIDLKSICLFFLTLTLTYLSRLEVSHQNLSGNSYLL